MGTDLRGAWLCLKYELAALYAGGRGGAVVATSSFLALGASPNTAIYAASKAGLDAMMRAAALEAGPRGVRLNTVRPGVIRPCSAAAAATRSHARSWRTRR